MTAYVLCYLTYEPNSKQKPIIKSLNTELIDSSLSNIKEELVQISANWIRDEIGKNNYQETLEDPRSLDELPDGLVRRYALTDSDKKDVHSDINKQINGNIIKQINIFRKTTYSGTIYGKWFDLELIRSYAIFKANCQNFGYTLTMSSPKSVETLGQSVGYDDVINQLKNFSRSSLRSLNKLSKSTLPIIVEEADAKNLFQDAFAEDDSSSSQDESSSSSDDDSTSDDEDKTDDDSTEWDEDEEVEVDGNMGYEIITKIPPPPPLPIFKLPILTMEEKEARKKLQ